MAKVQLIVEKRVASCNYFDGSRKPGDAVWVDEKHARELLESGVCRWPEGQASLPTDGLAPMRRAAGWPHDRFAVVDPVWKGETVVCIGGGPSVTQEAVNLTRGRARVVVINNSYLLAPWADVCYFADARWWGWHKDKPEFIAFGGQKVTIENTGNLVSDDNVFVLQNANMRGATVGLSEKTNAVVTGSNGGYQAIQIAVHAGAKRILLLGYDMRYGPGNKSHWHGGHPERMPERAYADYARKFSTMVPQLQRLGIEVINCTPGSLIDAFPRGDIASLLPPAR